MSYLNTIFEMLNRIIKEKTPQNIRIRYYPHYENIKNSDINELEVLSIKNMLKIDLEKIKSLLKEYPNISGKYTELGIKDTFVRINYDESNNETSRIYFRKQIFLFLHDNYSGIFIIEIFNICEQENLPHIIDYHYNANYDANTYTISFPTNKKIDNNFKICIINSEYLDFNRDLNINIDISTQIYDFIKDITPLVKKINKKL